MGWSVHNQGSVWFLSIPACLNHRAVSFIIMPVTYSGLLMCFVFSLKTEGRLYKWARNLGCILLRGPAYTENSQEVPGLAQSYL